MKMYLLKSSFKATEAAGKTSTDLNISLSTEAENDRLMMNLSRLHKHDAFLRIKKQNKKKNSPQNLI